MTLATAPPELPEGPPLPAHLALSDDHPLRAELCSPAQLAEAARALAAEARVVPRPSGRALPARLRSNGAFLADAYQRVAASAGRQEPLTPDAEWLLDNFYVVEEV